MNDKLPPSLNRFAAELEQAIRRELAPRRDRRLGRVLRARPRVLAGTTVGAAVSGAAVALVLSAAGSSPAFAVSRNHDGSYSVTLRTLVAIPAVNRKLSRLGVPARMVAAQGSCNWVSVAPRARRDVRIDAHTIPQGRTLVIAAWHDGRQVKVAASFSRAAVACVVPPCPPMRVSGRLTPIRHLTPIPVPGNFHQVRGSGNSGNSGNSNSRGSDTSGNSGNSGSGDSGSASSGNSGGWTVRSAGPAGGPPGQVPLPAVRFCGPLPAPGANGGNSGNSGSAGSGSAGSGSSSR